MTEPNLTGTILEMKSGIQPRCATGYSLGLMFALVDHVGDTSFRSMVKHHAKVEKLETNWKQSQWHGSCQKNQ